MVESPVVLPENPNEPPVPSEDRSSKLEILDQFTDKNSHWLGTGMVLVSATADTVYQLVTKQPAPVFIDCLPLCFGFSTLMVTAVKVVAGEIR